MSKTTQKLNSLMTKIRFVLCVFSDLIPANEIVHVVALGHQQSEKDTVQSP